MRNRFQSCLLCILMMWPLVSFPQGFTNEGTDFWMGFMQNRDPSLAVTLTLFISSDVNTSGNVSIPGMTFNQNFIVTAGTVTQVNVPTNQGMAQLSEVIERRAVHITALDTISVYAMNRRNVTSEAAVIYPSAVLGKEYHILSKWVANNANTPVSASQFMVVPRENNTTVIITPSANTMGGNTAGVPFSVTLNQGDVYQVMTETGDLSGTTVVSDTAGGVCRPFAVYSGNRWTTTVNAVGTRDHLYEQLPPLRTYGRQYLVSTIRTKPAYTLRLMGILNGTNVSINGGAPIALNAGTVVDTMLSVTSSIVSDNPVMAAQLCHPKDFDGVQNSDPYLLMLVPNEQHVGSSVFSTMGTGFTHFVNVFTETANIPLITLDAAAIPAANFTPVPSDPSWSFARLTLTTGSHVLQSDSGFIAYAYGFRFAESYAYATGQRLDDIALAFNVNDQLDTLFYASFDTACINIPIDFWGINDSSFTNWQWDFGDGNFGVGDTVQHTYTALGTYTVTLTVERPRTCAFDTLSQTIEVINCPILDLQFAYLQAEVQESGAVRLDWALNADSDPYRQVVERSPDGLHFRAVGAVAAPAQGRAYTHMDLPPTLPQYYRIRAVTQDGHHHHSEIRYAYAPHTDAALLLYPTHLPTGQPLKLLLPPTHPPTHTPYTLYAPSGRQIRTPSHHPPPAGKPIEISTTGLSPGIYFLHIHTPDRRRHIRKFILY